VNRLLPSALLILALLAASLWQPFPPDAIDLDRALLGPGATHWLGTDDLGRDVLSRLMAGGARTATVLLVVTAATALVGGTVGLTAALAGGSVERVLLRLADLSVVVPQMVVALALTALFGLSPVTAGLALAAGGGGGHAIAAYGLAHRLLAEPFVLSAAALGAGRVRVALVHLLPAVAPTVLVLVAADAGRAVLNFAALAFLGLGADTGGHDWGAMMFEYRDHGLDHPHLLLAPGAAIATVAFVLSRALDPGVDGPPPRRPTADPHP
jgi:peptide/nickel transport system permease protein